MTEREPVHPDVEAATVAPSADGSVPDARRLVRNLAWMMVGWASPALLVALARLDARAGATLTLCLALSIVHLRSLQAQVSRLDPVAPLRAGVLAFVRWGFLVLGLLGILSFGVSRPLALVWGISLLPLALITEAARSALASRS